MRRNCLLKDVSEGKIKGRIKVTGRRGRRRTELLDCLKETRGYWKLKEEAVDRTVWRTGCGRGGGPVARQTAVRMVMQQPTGVSESDQSVLSVCMWCLHRTCQLHTNKHCALCQSVIPSAI
jgi:hypothetical protein